MVLVGNLEGPIMIFGFLFVEIDMKHFISYIYRYLSQPCTRVQAWVIEYMQVPFIETQHSIY